LFVLAPRLCLGCEGRSTGGVLSFFGDEAMVRGNRFGHSQAGRPTLRGGCIDRGGWVKKARTNKSNVEWGWAGFRVRRRPPFFVPVPRAWLGCGGRPTGKVCFRRWLVDVVRVRGTGFLGWGSFDPHPKRWPHRTLNWRANRRCSFLRPGCAWVVGDDQQAGFCRSLETKRWCEGIDSDTRRPGGLRYGVDASTVVDR
jgi:hypothetical protein